MDPKTITTIGLESQQSNCNRDEDVEERVRILRMVGHRDSDLSISSRPAPEPAIKD